MHLQCHLYGIFFKEYCQTSHVTLRDTLEFFFSFVHVIAMRFFPLQFCFYFVRFLFFGIYFLLSLLFFSFSNKFACVKFYLFTYIYMRISWDFERQIQCEDEIKEGLSSIRVNELTKTKKEFAYTKENERRKIIICWWRTRFIVESLNFWWTGLFIK